MVSVLESTMFLLLYNVNFSENMFITAVCIIFLLLGLTELADPDNKKEPMTGHLDKNLAMRSCNFLFYSTVISKVS